MAFPAARLSTSRLAGLSSRLFPALSLSSAQPRPPRPSFTLSPGSPRQLPCSCRGLHGLSASPPPLLSSLEKHRCFATSRKGQRVTELESEESEEEMELSESYEGDLVPEGEEWDEEESTEEEDE